MVSTPIVRAKKMLHVMYNTLDELEDLLEEIEEDINKIDTEEPQKRD